MTTALKKQLPAIIPVARSEGEVFADHVKEQLEGRMAEPAGWWLLLAVYIRPSFKDLGGGKMLHFADATRDEDFYQGNVGYVLAVGPDAYQAERFGGHAWAKVGDWVLFPANEVSTRKFEITGRDGKPVKLVMIHDDQLTARVPEPGLAMRIR